MVANRYGILVNYSDGPGFYKAGSGIAAYLTAVEVGIDEWCEPHNYVMDGVEYRLANRRALLLRPSVLSDVLCLGDMKMKCEHCGQPAMRGWIICKRCWWIFGGEECTTR